MSPDPLCCTAQCTALQCCESATHFHFGGALRARLGLSKPSTTIHYKLDKFHTKNGGVRMFMF